MAPANLTLEAAIDPAAGAGLFRRGPLAALRAGRTRSAALTLVWLDTEEETLADQGLALEAPSRGPRQLIRTLPDADDLWCPGTPAAVIETLEADAEAAGAEATALLPVARFEGRRRVMALRDGMEAVLLEGRLIAGEATQPAVRLTLTGPRAAVVGAMRDLAAALPATPPRLSLAEEGRALARDAAPRPRRLGAPRLDSDLGVEQALRLVIGHLAEVIAWHAPVAAAGTDPTGVHQMRVALRRLRSALRAFRGAADAPALRDFDAGLKSLATLLGPARDWDVFLGGLGAELAEAMPEEPRIGALLAEAGQRRALAYERLAEALRGPGFRGLLWEAVALEALRPWRAVEDDTEAAERRALPLDEFAAMLLDKQWRRLTGVGSAIDHLPDDEFHALRLQGKRMRYLGELFAPLWGRKRAKRLLERLEAVQEQFGLANDTAVARALVAPLAPAAGEWATGVAEGWVMAKSSRARRQAERAWKKLLAAEPFWNQG